MRAIFCPSCGEQQPSANPHLHDYYRCQDQDCGVAFIEEPWTDIIDEHIFAAASALSRSLRASLVGVVCSA